MKLGNNFTCPCPNPNNFPRLKAREIIRIWTKRKWNYSLISLVTIWLHILILFVYKLMIGSSKNNGENYPRKCFWTQEKETRVKFNPGSRANRPSNNWALLFHLFRKNNPFSHVLPEIKMMLQEMIYNEDFLCSSVGTKLYDLWIKCNLILDNILLTPGQKRLAPTSLRFNMGSFIIKSCGSTVNHVKKRPGRYRGARNRRPVSDRISSYPSLPPFGFCLKRVIFSRKWLNEIWWTFARKVSPIYPKGIPNIIC